MTDRAACSVDPATCAQSGAAIEPGVFAHAAGGLRMGVPRDSASSGIINPAR